MSTPVPEILQVAETVVLQLIKPDHRATERSASLASTAAADGRLWAGLSTAAMLHQATRRAGATGLVAWGLGSGVAMAVKTVTDRPRPVVIHARGRAPKTSSMPSSHSAGAAAYATAATLANPPVGLLVVPAAALVAWSRAATARHFPTDVLAGIALGVAVGVGVHAAAGRVTDRRPRAADPDAVGEPSQQPMAG